MLTFRPTTVLTISVRGEVFEFPTTKPHDYMEMIALPIVMPEIPRFTRREEAQIHKIVKRAVARANDVPHDYERYLDVCVNNLRQAAISKIVQEWSADAGFRDVRFQSNSVMFMRTDDVVQLSKVLNDDNTICSNCGLPLVSHNKDLHCLYEPTEFQYKVSWLGLNHKGITAKTLPEMAHVIARCREELPEYVFNHLKKSLSNRLAELRMGSYRKELQYERALLRAIRSYLPKENRIEFTGSMVKQIQSEIMGGFMGMPGKGWNPYHRVGDERERESLRITPPLIAFAKAILAGSTRVNVAFDPDEIYLSADGYPPEQRELPLNYSSYTVTASGGATDSTVMITVPCPF